MKLFIALFFLNLYLASLALAGSEGNVGNGGDVVYCKQSTLSKFSGYYSLDYLLTYQEKNKNSDILPDSGEKIFDRLLRFSSSFPGLASSFLYFTNIEDGQNAPASWREAPFGLIDIHDENISRFVPANCYIRTKNSRAIQIIQAVRRFETQAGEVFEYDPKILRHLHKSPLQFSFLLVHEWAWSLTKNVDTVRELNRYLHSKEFADASLSDFAAKMKQLGIAQPSLPKDGEYVWPNVYERGKEFCNVYVTSYPSYNTFWVQIIEDGRGCWFKEGAEGKFECFSDVLSKTGYTLCFSTDGKKALGYTVDYGVLKWAGGFPLRQVR